jgi:hypothetical protein
MTHIRELEATIDALAAFPAQLEQLFYSFPPVTSV